jgi:Zn-finger nucleic acid-binding protein
MITELLSKIGLDFNRKTVCRKCGVEFQMGYNGIANNLCDRCAGVKRDRKGEIVVKQNRASRQGR